MMKDPLTIMPEYRGMIYVKDRDGLWKVKINNDWFIVALDDSKNFGVKRIVWPNNTSEICKRFIDWSLDARQRRA